MEGEREDSVMNAKERKLGEAASEGAQYLARFALSG